MKAQHPARCARCGGVIERGAEMDYVPPSNTAPAFTAHQTCPEKPAVGTKPLCVDCQRPLALGEQRRCAACYDAWANRVLDAHDAVQDEFARRYRAAQGKRQAQKAAE